MNTRSSAMPQTQAAARDATAREIPAGRRMYWSVRRELWENRSIYLAPLAVAGLIVVGYLLATMRLAIKLRAGAELHAFEQNAATMQPYNAAGMLIMLTTFLVALFYCLDALYGERRDRSVLFWKSLPVSDLTSVVAKASVPLVILPVLTFVITVFTQWMMLVVGSVVLLGSGGHGAGLWGRVPLFSMWVMLGYHLLAIHALWYAPIYGWLLLVSAWARRLPLLWAVLPPLAIAVVEKIAFDSGHFAGMLMNRMAGGPEGADYTANPMAMDALSQLHPGMFLLRPGLWVGLAVAGMFLAGAVQMRHSRGPS